jgi:hypothetical protein
MTASNLPVRQCEKLLIIPAQASKDNKEIREMKNRKSSSSWKLKPHSLPMIILPRFYFTAQVTKIQNTASFE